MSRTKIFLLTSLAMIAFAGNSLLCRMALKHTSVEHTSIDAASFTSIRIIAGALTLWFIMRMRASTIGGGNALAYGSWPSAFALFAYAACFSFAYVSLSAATGALLLFGAVQFCMISYGFWNGERFSARQWLGLVSAFAGLAGLMLPGLTAPPLLGSALMLCAGAAWGVYSLRGRNSLDPLATTAGNFVKSLPFALLAAILGMVGATHARFDTLGLVYAVLSGAVTSGIGYAIWYRALKHLTATAAATVQLSVPVIAAVGGALWIGDDLSLRLAIGSAVVLGGIGISFVKRRAS